MAEAAPPKSSISIAAQPVAAALRELSGKAAVNILFSPEAVAAYHAPAVHQAGSMEDALRIILSRAPLDAVHDAGGGWIVTRHRAPPQPAGPIADDASRRSRPGRSRSPSPPRSDPALPSDIVVTGDNGADGVAQRSPFAITSISSDQIVKSGTTTLSGLASLSPGLQVAPVRTTALTFLRGVGTTITSPNADPTIAIDLNGAYVPMEMTASIIFDLDRIDVVPGPQGTAYGRNSTGGVIDLVTRKPGDVAAMNGLVEFGDYGRIQVQTGIDTPITDRLALRTALSLIRHDGYDSNGGDDQNSKAVRLTAVWKPDAADTLTAVATFSRDGGIGPFNFNVPAVYGPYRDEAFDPQALGFFIDYRTFTGSVQADHAFSPAVRLSYVGAYYHLHQQTATAAWSSTPVATLDAAQANDTASQEVRLTARAGRLDVKAALYWFDSDARYASVTDDRANPVRTANSIGPFTATSHGWAAYGQGTYTLADTLRLTGGLRFSRTVKAVTGTDITTISDAATGGGMVTAYPFAGRVSLDHADWRVGAEKDLSGRSLAYASIATGVTPGGFSAAPAAIGQPDALAFRPAYLTAYTIGIKNRLADNRFTINAEGFWYRYRNYQVSQRNLATNENNVYNAGSARVYGVQIDSRANLTPHDFLWLSLSLQRARALSLETPAGTFDGDQLPFAPDATVRASYRHLFPLAAGGQIEASANGEWTSSRWGTYTHSAGTFVRPTWKADATITYREPRNRYSVSLWVRNITDAIVPTQITAAPPPAGPGQEFLSPPRTFGIRFGYDF